MNFTSKSQLEYLNSNSSDVSVLIAISSNGGITRDLPTIISAIATNSINFRMVVDLNSEEIVWKNPKWEYLANSEPTTYYHYEEWEYHGQKVGMTLNPEETETLDEIFDYDFLGDDYYEEIEEHGGGYCECKR